jgi:hypothetical protein
LDDFYDSLGVGEDIIVPESDNAISVSLELGSAFLIGFYSHGMLPTIELDDEKGFHGCKIRNVRADGRLAAKLDTVELSVSKMLPKLPFSVG